jgi:hypothetical protein
MPMKNAEKGRGNVLASGIGAALLLGIVSGFVAGQGRPDVLGKLGLDRPSAGTGILRALTEGDVYNPAAFDAFKALSASARADIVRAGLAWAKTYVGMPEFKAAYMEYRDGRKPRPPDPVPSAKEPLAKMKADAEKSIADMRQMQASGNAEMKKSIEEAIKQLRAQIEAMDKDPKMMESLRQAAEMERTQKQNDYELGLKNWNKELPEDPRALIADRIREFLAASADVDFSAELTTRHETMAFVNKEYERKPAHWKICFRAGKEATEAARAFAKTWLEELKSNGAPAEPGRRAGSGKVALEGEYPEAQTFF